MDHSDNNETSPRRRRVTSVDVAREAGVSQALVSRAISGKGGVAPGTRGRILEAADRLGWIPNALAASVVTGDAPLIAVIAARLNLDWRAKVLSRLFSAFEADGIVPLLFYANSDDEVSGLLREASTWQTRGVVVTAGVVAAPRAAAILDAGRFLISFNRPVPHPDAFAVGTDNAAGGREAARLLVGDGRERLLMLAGPEQTWAGSQRLAGFRAEAPECTVWHSAEMSVEAGSEAACRWLEQPVGERADGIFAVNDLTAFGFLDGIRAGGIDPATVSLVGFDDLPMASWPPYRLTTFAQPVNRLVQQVLDHITAYREGGVPATPAEGAANGMSFTPPSLVVRATAGGGS